jgi:hypothetical protein
MNKHGFMHGFTKGSTQSAYCEHIRWEYPYALLHTAHSAYVQDTTHLIHSTPLAMIMMGFRG